MQTTHPGHAAPQRPATKPGLCRRLYTRAKIAYLKWQLRDMRAQLNRLAAEMAECTELAADQARQRQHSLALRIRRCTLRSEHQALANEWLRVANEVYVLEASL